MKGEERELLKKQQSDWDEFARLDHRFAICPDDTSRRGRWSSEEFWDTGRTSVAALLDYLRGHAPGLRFGSALDFGCGVGRETRPMADAWKRVVGMDVSAEMIEMARRYHADAPNCSFVHNELPRLEPVADDSMDFVYCNRTLSCIPSEKLVEHYVGEFFRVLSPGGYTYFQLPARIPLLRRIKLRRHLYRLLRRLGAAPEVLFNRFVLHPTAVRAVDPKRVHSWIEGRGTLVHFRDDPGMETYYLLRKDSSPTGA